MLHERDICWELAPAPALDVMRMSDEALIAHAISEAGAYRQLAQAALHALYATNQELERVRAQHHRVLVELRELRLRGVA